MSSELDALNKKIYTAGDGRQMSMMDLLALFRRQGSSRVTDLHLKVGRPPCYRVDGDLKMTSARPLDAITMERLARTLLDDTQIKTLHEKRSVNASRLIGEFRYRLNAYFDVHGMSMAIRALDTTLPTIPFIGFPNDVWKDIVNLGQGLVLVTGTTGAGKSTTIAALINEIAHTRPCHIITLEDPIEYEFNSDISLISQRALGRDVHSYGQGLRDCLREDPDVIFVGEMVDPESAMWTLAAAETGHLVFSGIHTRNAIGTVTRLIDMFPANRADEIANQLSLALRYIISQKLVQRQDRYGRMAVMEVLNNTFSVANCIRQLKLEQIYSIMQTHTRDEPGQRMTTLERTLATLVKRGIVAKADAERAVNEPRIFEDELNRT